MSNNHSRLICVRGIIYRAGKLFCQELKRKDGSLAGFYCTPGGGLDPGESLIDGVKRELVEETGVIPQVGKLLFIQQYSDKDGEYLEFFFHIENTEAYEAIDLDQTSHGTIEVDHCEFVDPKLEHVLPEFLSTIDIESYIVQEKPPYMYYKFGQ